jgi:hypothetical protein
LADVPQREFVDSAVLARLSRLAFLPRGPVIGNTAGQHKSPHRGSSVEFAEYRKYVQGDDIRHVDWRVYGRTDRFYMKEFEADTNMRCMLLVDCSRSMAFGEAGKTKFDYARRMAATLAHLLVRQGDSVGLMCFSDEIVHEIPPRHKASHLGHIFNALADTKPAGTTDLSKILHQAAEKISRRALVIVLSDFFTSIPDLLNCFKHIQFRKHDLAVFHLLHDEELNFRFDRPTRFADMETSFNMITDPAMVRDLYIAELDQYLDDIKHGCAEFQVDYQRTLLSVHYEEALADFLLQRMGRPRSTTDTSPTGAGAP